jgi:hypothetical protein
MKIMVWPKNIYYAIKFLYIWNSKFCVSKEKKGHLCWKVWECQQCHLQVSHRNLHITTSCHGPTSVQRSSIFCIISWATSNLSNVKWVQDASSLCRNMKGTFKSMYSEEASSPTDGDTIWWENDVLWFLEFFWRWYFFADSLYTGSQWLK